MPRLGCLAAILLTAACAANAPTEPVASRIGLRAALATSDAHPVGVAIDRAGTRLVLDGVVGLVRLDAAGEAQVVRALADLPTPSIPLELPVTDLVALGDDRFALTAIGNGYRLDLAADTMDLFFCYEPGGFPDDQRQRTDAVAVDPVEGRLYAQPRTFTTDGTFVRSEVASYDGVSGTDLTWSALPGEFTAGGMVAPGDGTLLLGAGTALHRFDLATSAVAPVDDLARFGVGAIDGLALDPATGTLVVVDGDHDELVEIALDQLTL